MKVRAQDRIRLPSGEEMTLADAIDRGLVTLESTERWTRKTDMPRAIRTYVARTLDGTHYWDIGKTLYESRTQCAVSISKDPS